MPQTGSMILREAREAAGLSRDQLSMRMECVSVGTIKRWEYGETKPESPDVARMGELFGDETLWPRWMCATDDEYARRHPYCASQNNVALDVINAGYQMADVHALTDALARDLLDGKVDDKATAERYIKEAEEAAAALLAAAGKLKGGL